MAVDFGRDTSCPGSLRTGRYASGVRLVAEAAYRRLITPRGSLRGGEEEQNYGFDLADVVGSASTPSAVASLPARIRNELMKDERIDDVEVTVVASTTGPATTWAITVQGYTGIGPFRLVLAVSDVTVALVGLEA